MSINRSTLTGGWLAKEEVCALFKNKKNLSNGTYYVRLWLAICAYGHNIESISLLRCLLYPPPACVKL